MSRAARFDIFYQGRLYRKNLTAAEITKEFGCKSAMVYQAANAVSIPVIGMGGIACAEDALEFILAGASAVSIGTANFFNPYAAEETVQGIEAYMREKKVDRLTDLIGIVK